MRQRQIHRGTESLSLDTASILDDLRRHWWNILLTAVAGGMLAFSLLGGMIRPTFQSEAVLAVIGNSGSSVSNVQNASRMSSAITSVFDSTVFRQIVSDRLETSSYTLSAEYIQDTNLISVTATAGSARLAFQSLRTALSEYPELLSDLMSDLYIVTVQQPEVSDKAQGLLPLGSLILIGTVLGAVGYAGAVVMLSILRDTVKNESDMRNKVDGQLLGTIPFLEVRAQQQERLVLAKQKYLDFRYEENFQLIASRVVSNLDQNRLQVLTLTSVTPNEGKTHALLNLAYCISKMQKSVLVIDGDFRNPSMGKLFPECQKSAGLSEALDAKCILPECLHFIPNTQMCCLINQVRNTRLSHSLSNGSFAAILAQARQMFDYVLVDTGPAALVADTAVIAAQCEASVLLVTQEAAGIRAINDTIDLLDQEGEFLGCIYREIRSGRNTVSHYDYGPYRYSANAKKQEKGMKVRGR